jgi:hypothetical protein
MLGFFEGLKAEDLPDGQGWAIETVQLSTHNGTQSSCRRPVSPCRAFRSRSNARRRAGPGRLPF